MRVDRNGSILSILFITLSEEGDLALMERVLEGRLRLTDTPGMLNDGRIVLLLPDTPEEGAWKVAADISEVYPPGPHRPQCDVIVYPDVRTKRIKEVSDSSHSLGVAPSGTDAALLFCQPLPRWKRFLDIIGSITCLIAMAPTMALAAIAIKLTSPGPILFSQEREGLGGKRFRIWKMRTMIDGADELKHTLSLPSHQDGPAFKMKTDPRTTPVGRILRWTSIDELPQFWNVLKGDMSLVGPRPLPTSESQACANWQRRRLSVPPGMTCTWQVFARGNVSFDEWMRMDLQYSRQVSLWGDIKLAMLTLPSLLLHKGIR
ncbi:sugar transferase [Bythopirellula goksoeyrii]|nr:sugar transferase [Bythopirellula goksoeyrii]